jgi:hypothetical protein
MHGIDWVWERLADRAALHAQAGDPVSLTDARRIVGYLCSEFAERPSDEAIEGLAGELVRLTLEATDHLHQRHRKSIHGIA